LQYASGIVSRVFLARFDHGEEILAALRSLCAREGVKAGWFHLFGALADGRLVAGPKETALPPEPRWLSLGGVHEVVGTGSVAAGPTGEPEIHLHASFGRGTEVLTGCLREEGRAFVVVEAILFELSGIDASRRHDGATGLDLLSVAPAPAAPSR
jgi:predicted DNA-binding protein with PD1-like motif